MPYWNRRAIGRAETDDFRCFPLPEMIAWSGADVSPTDQWYGPQGKSLYPGTTDYHLMFPLLWKVEEDLFYTCMASSFEGGHWSFLSPGPIMGPGDFGAADAGGIVVDSGLVELPGDHVGVLARGNAMPHKYPFRPAHPPGAKYWATWPRERLVALVADDRGEFRTNLLSFQGAQIRINARTRHTGYILIQVTNDKDQPLPGCTFEDCDRITGDFMDHSVSWHDQSRLPCDPAQPLRIWFRMQSAELFALRFE